MGEGRGKYASAKAEATASAAEWMNLRLVIRSASNCMLTAAPLHKFLNAYHIFLLSLE